MARAEGGRAEDRSGLPRDWKDGQLRWRGCGRRLGRRSHGWLHRRTLPRRDWRIGRSGRDAIRGAPGEGAAQEGGV